MKFARGFALWVVAALSVAFTAAQAAPAPAASRAQEEQQTAKQLHLTPAENKLKTFRTMFAYSDTVYLDSKLLQDALMKRFEINAWKITWSEKESADVAIKVWRPTFTFDWRYQMVDATAGRVLASGRIVAWDGKRAADGIAADIARSIGRVRALPMHLLAALNEEANARKWKLTYQHGSEGPRPGTELWVSVSPERIVGRRQHRVMFVIPTQTVGNVSYNPITHDRAQGWTAFANSWYDAGASSGNVGGMLAFLPVDLVTGSVLRGLKTTEHFCDIAWTDDGAVREILMKADNSVTAQAFLAAVEEVTKRKATDMAAESAALRDALERENREGRLIPVRFERKTAIGWKVLEPGGYRVAVVERGDPKRGIAYFMPDGGTPEVKTVLAQMPVTIDSVVTDLTIPVTHFAEVNGVASINDITTATRTLRFGAVPLEFATAPQISETMEEALFQAALKPSYRSVHVKSDTVYLKGEVMEQALSQHPAVMDWEMKIVARFEEADLDLLVTRPFLTFDWTYAITEVKTGKKVAEGRITARDGGRAATLIADQFVNALKADVAREIRKEAE